MGNRYVGALVLSCLSWLGCEHDPLAKVPVQGTVTFDGQACPASGRVTFSPVEVAAGMPVRPAIGKFETDGKYAASSFRPADGLVPGKYMVGIGCYDPTQLSGAPSDAEWHEASFVSEDFQPLELVVEPGSDPITFDIDVPMR